MPDIFTRNEKRRETEIPPSQPKSMTSGSIDRQTPVPYQPLSFFATYTLHPKGVTVAIQEPDEVMLLFLRKHFITNFPWILSTLLLFLIPPFFFFVLPLLNSFTFPKGLLIVLIAFYYLLLLGYGFNKFTAWFYTIGIVTQERIMYVNSENILANITMVNITDVIDAIYRQQGFIHKRFNYADITVLTKTTENKMIIDACPKPKIVRKQIHTLRTAMKGHSDGNS